MPDSLSPSARPGSAVKDSHNLQPARLTVVGIGASAGGLEACTRLVQGLADGNGMAFVLVQHLDPTHDSPHVPLLATQTAMPVLEAANGMLLERDHVYVIPPGTYLSVEKGSPRLSKPQAPRGLRLPFDFLLTSLAKEYGKRAVCVILFGTGADGSTGLAVIKKRGGLVIAQDPSEAEYDGMPKSTIATRLVDLILPAADMPDALATHPHPLASGYSSVAEEDPEHRAFAEIIELLRAATPHDFTLYKPGTPQRRRYLTMLRRDKEEAGRLSTDLLINVIGFFRDPKVFERPAADTIPDLIRGHDASQPLRVWVAGCSTGEKTWSLAMLFREQLAEPPGRDHGADPVQILPRTGPPGPCRSLDRVRPRPRSRRAACQSRTAIALETPLRLCRGLVPPGVGGQAR